MDFPLSRTQLRRGKLPLKIGAGAALGVALLSTAAAIGGVLGWWIGALLTVAAGVSAFAVSHRLLVPRLDLAHSTLKQIRKHEFENLEAARIQKGDELNALIWQVYRTGLALEKEIQELQRIESHRRDFLSNVSHELKTPIFAIQGFAETLLDGALEDERVNRRFVEKIRRNSIRLRNLTRDLGEISQIETGDLRMTSEPFTLQRIAREVLESMEPLVEEKGVRLQYDIPPGLPSAIGDAERIRQVLINLIENAIKYNKRNGSVTLSARQTGRQLRVEISDEGIGISPQHIPRLTERFFRVDTSRSRNQGGTGLGLAIVKHILNAHNQRLDVTSTPGEGSTFAFNLPIHTRDEIPVHERKGGSDTEQPIHT